MPSKGRGSGTRSAATPQVTRPTVQRGGISSNQSNTNVGHGSNTNVGHGFNGNAERGFTPAGPSWGLSSSFSGGTSSSLHFQLIPN